MTAKSKNHSHAYNPSGPIAYFITFHTYGTWLHGDRRGSIDRKGWNVPGTPMVTPDPMREQEERVLRNYPPVTFNKHQRKAIDEAIRNVIAYKNWTLHALNPRTEHVHVVVTALKRPELIMNSLKSWCTRRMREAGLWTRENSPWSRHGSTRYLWDEQDLANVCDYVNYGQ